MLPINRKHGTTGGQRENVALCCDMDQYTVYPRDKQAPVVGDILYMDTLKAFWYTIHANLWINMLRFKPPHNSKHTLNTKQPGNICFICLGFEIYIVNCVLFMVFEHLKIVLTV